MKIVSFLMWKLKQSTVFDWIWALGAALVGAGAVRYENDGKYFLIVGVSLWILTIFFEVIIRGIKRDYARFVEEQNQLFTTIKNSDKK